MGYPFQNNATPAFFDPSRFDKSPQFLEQILHIAGKAVPCFYRTYAE
jgi:hypothetical protein